MIYAKEMATAGHVASITTVSRRGRPAAPGPAAAFLSVMAQETVHYMAACDQTDAKAVECLTQWAPPAPAGEEQEEESMDTAAMLYQLKSDISGMSDGELNSTLKFLDGLKLQIVSSLR